jgi:hypothetical protein
MTQDLAGSCRISVTIPATAAGAAAAADVEEMQGLDISKHGERAVSELVHIEAYAKENSVHGKKTDKAADLTCAV